MELTVGKQQKVFGTPLDVRGVTRDPVDLQPLTRQDELVTALAHLLGFDGAKSIFLKASALGALKTNLQSVAGNELAIAAAGGVTVAAMSDVSWTRLLQALGAGSTVNVRLEITFAGALVSTDLGAAGSWVTFSALSTPVLAYSSATAGAKTNPLGAIYAGQRCYTYVPDRYLDLDPGAGTGKCHLIQWQ